jgi:hypothetical protein
VKKPRVYVGCSVTDASKKFTEDVELFKMALEEHFVVLRFVVKKPGDSINVYVHDIEHCLQEANMMIAVCDERSIGVGIEIGAALWRKPIPILIIAHEDSRVTSFLNDMVNELRKKERAIDFQRYQSLLPDVKDIAVAFARRHNLPS